MTSTSSFGAWGWGWGKDLIGGSYAAKILSTSAANLLAYWPLNEASGTTADNAEGTAALDGTYAAVTLGQTGIGDGNTSASFDGSTSKLTLPAAALITAGIDLTEGTFVAWIKPNVAMLTDGAYHNILTLKKAAGPSELIIQKTNVHSTYEFYYRSAATAKSCVVINASTAYYHFAARWSLSGDAINVYVNGTPATPTTTLPTLVSSIDTSWIGAGSATPTGVWSGLMAHCAIFTTPLSNAQILDLATI